MAFTKKTAAEGTPPASAPTAAPTSGLPRKLGTVDVLWDFSESMEDYFPAQPRLLAEVRRVIAAVDERGLDVVLGTVSAMGDRSPPRDPGDAGVVFAPVASWRQIQAPEIKPGGTSPWPRLLAGHARRKRAWLAEAVVAQKKHHVSGTVIACSDFFVSGVPLGEAQAAFDEWAAFVAETKTRVVLVAPEGPHDGHVARLTFAGSAGEFKVHTLGQAETVNAGFIKLILDEILAATSRATGGRKLEAPDGRLVIRATETGE
jgi:hypothetical protein